VGVRVRVRVRLGVREGEGASPRATEHEPPLLDAQVLPQTLDVLHEVGRRVGDERGAQVVGRVGHRAAGAALVEAHDAVVARVEEAAAALVAPGARAAMQEDGRHALRVATLLVVQAVPIAHVEHTRVVRLEWRVELCATRGQGA
jgi:hypothetical protein